MYKFWITYSKEVAPPELWLCWKSIYLQEVVVKVFKKCLLAKASHKKKKVFQRTKFSEKTDK